MYSIKCPFYDTQDLLPCQFCIMRMQAVNSSSRYRNLQYTNSHDYRIKKSFTTEEAIEIARKLNIKFDKFDIEQFRMGLDVELEHGSCSSQTNITNDDPLITGKITLAHLNEFPDYYTKLYKLENDAKDFWGEKD